jgi:hypothetical protein
MIGLAVVLVFIVVQVIAGIAWADHLNRRDGKLDRGRKS